MTIFNPLLATSNAPSTSGFLSALDGVGGIGGIGGGAPNLSSASTQLRGGEINFFPQNTRVESAVKRISTGAAITDSPGGANFGNDDAGSVGGIPIETLLIVIAAGFAASKFLG